MTSTTQPMPSSGRLSYSIFQELRAIDLPLPGNLSEGMMDRWQATLYALLMTSESQDRDVREFGKLVTPSAHVRVTWVYRTLYENSGLLVGRVGLEHGLV